MREGVNPEKYKAEENQRYLHRIIVPVFVPNTSEAYFQEADEILERCLYSLTETINPRTTAISIINNACCDSVSRIIKKYYNQGLIDKYILNRENKGKVYSVVNEAKAAFEPFITIADADVLFLPGWENAVFEVYQEFPQAGVVAPLPSQNNSFYFNSSVFYDNYLTSSMKYGKAVNEKDSELFLNGLGNPSLLDRNNRKFSWKEKQYYLNKEKIAVVGAGHFAATYRSSLFKKDFPFPTIKFRNGLEKEYLDKPADQKGLYRLSTHTTFAYHMGNRIDDFSRSVEFKNVKKVQENLILGISEPSYHFVPYQIRNLFYRGLRKIKNL